MKVGCLIPNEDFLKNMSENFIEELIHINEPIPMRIRSMLIVYIPNFNWRRSNFLVKMKNSFLRFVKKDLLHAN